MKNRIPPLPMAGLTLLMTMPLFAQQQPVWLSHYEDGSDRGGLELVMDQAGNIYGTGQIKGLGMSLDGHNATAEGESDIVLMKLDSTGHALWIKQAGGFCYSQSGDDSYEIGYGIAVDEQAQHLIVMGRYSSNATFGTITLPGGCTDQQQDIFIAAYDTTGTCLWANGIYSIGGGAGLLLGHASDSYLFCGVGFLTGEFYNGGAALYHYAPDGAQLSAERIMLHGAVSDAEWWGDDLLMCGRFQSADSLWDMALNAQAPYGDGFLARADTAGHVQWLIPLHSVQSATIQQVRLLDAGSIVCAGSYGGHAYFGMDTLSAGYFLDAAHDTISYSAFVAMYDSSGSLIWAKNFYSTTFYTWDDMEIGPDGYIYIMGHFTGDLRIGATMLHADAGTEMYVAKLDTLGNCVAALQVGGTTPYGGGSLLVNERGLFASFK